jgi:uncharacterized protein (DUF1800 family)
MNPAADPWAPYQPGPKDPWDLRKVAHLHRRAGFGATWAELVRDLRDGPERSIDRLLSPAEPAKAERDLTDELGRAAAASEDGQRAKAWWLYRILYGPDPLAEKLTLFWHGHFATSRQKVRRLALMLRQHETFRRHALGDFRALLAAMVSDPAMLIWLDGRHNRRRACNENFGREFLELFTLGVGRYTEADVRAAARAFTGWVDAPADPKGDYRFDPVEFDAGPKTLLGKSGPWGWEDAVRIVLEERASAEFLCGKLYRFLVAEEPAPAPELTRPLAEKFRSSKYSVREVVSTILRSRHFFAKSTYRARVKSPVEYSAGLVRALEEPRASVRLLALAAACDRQGQELFAPPSVKGWDGGRAWLDTSATLERSNWAADVVWGNPQLGMEPFDPLAWAERVGVARGDIAGAFLDLTVQGDLTDSGRALVLAAARTGDVDGLRKALQRAVHCPTYQLA